MSVVSKSNKMITSESDLPFHVATRIKQIARFEEFADYAVKAVPGSEYGDGMSAEILCVVVSGKQCKNGESSEAELHLLCKSAPANKNRRKEFFIDVLYEREVNFYTKVLPAFERFQNHKNLPREDQFSSVPKCYSAVADEPTEEYLIILSDLRFERFKMRPKCDPIPIQNHRLVMQELGKFHGISFAMKDQWPDVFSQFKSLQDISRMYFKSASTQNVFSSSVSRAMTVLKKDEHKRIFEEIGRDPLAHLDPCLNLSSASRFGVLTHGDCWNNNVLYRLDDNVSNLRLCIDNETRRI